MYKNINKDYFVNYRLIKVETFNTTPTSRFKSALVFWKLKSAGSINEAEDQLTLEGIRRRVWRRNTISLTPRSDKGQFKFPYDFQRRQTFWNTLECAKENKKNKSDQDKKFGQLIDNNKAKDHHNKNFAKRSKMNSSFNLNSGSSTLSRSQTPNLAFGSATRPAPSPKCFGRNTHILKEEYERERVRWQQKLEEVEQKLTEASINNSELFQIKAELNRKIIDFGKNQRPMIEQNRRLNDRIRTLNAEIKELEKKLAFAQDDFLSLRDAYDRLVKENSLLKEQRAFPEKLEELNRYRNQVLEYSKCIIALRNSAAEKDCRYEMIVQKFRKYRKMLATQKLGTCSDCNGKVLSSSSGVNSEDDRQSYVGSESSMDSSLTYLDTINEDMEFSADMLQSTLNTNEFGLKQQLELANLTIAELQNSLEMNTYSNVFQLEEEIKSLQEAKRSLETELANTQHNNELLEFQLTELTEGFQDIKKNGFSDKQCSTDIQIPSTAGEYCEADFVLCNRLNISVEDAAQACKGLLYILRTYASILPRSDFENIRKAIEITDAFQNQLSFIETELNMANCELNRVRHQIDEVERCRQLEECSTIKQQKKKELQSEIEKLKKEKKDDAKKSVKQINEFETIIEQKAKEIAEKTDQIRHLNGEIRVMSTKIENQTAELTANSSVIDNLRSQFEQLSADLISAKIKIEEAQQNSYEEKNSLIKQVNELENSNNNLSAIIDGLRVENANLQKNDKLESVNREKEELKLQLEAIYKENEVERKMLEEKRQILERELSDARAQIFTLKEQVRPIGTQLERRYEEARYRLTEALKKIHELELREAVTVISRKADDERINESEKTWREKFLQSDAYNREIQQQFDAQCELMNALKKEIIMLKSRKATHSTDSIDWTSNSSGHGDGTNSDSANSIEDDQYHPKNEGCDKLTRRINDVSKHAEH